MLQVDPADLVMLVLSWHFGAAHMCEYTKEEFIQGMTSLQCDSIRKLARRLPESCAEAREEATFKVCHRDLLSSLNGSYYNLDVRGVAKQVRVACC